MEKTHKQRCYQTSILLKNKLDWEYFPFLIVWSLTAYVMRIAAIRFFQLSCFAAFCGIFIVLHFYSQMCCAPRHIRWSFCNFHKLLFQSQFNVVIIFRELLLDNYESNFNLIFASANKCFCKILDVLKL